VEKRRTTLDVLILELPTMMLPIVKIRLRKQ